MTLSPTSTLIIGKSLGYLLIVVLLPIFAFAYIVAGVVAGFRWVWGAEPREARR